MSSTSAYNAHERFYLYTSLDAFYFEPRTKHGDIASDSYLSIDRVSNDIAIENLATNPIPTQQTDMRPIYGIWGIITLVAGNYLIVITKAEIVGQINDCDIYHVLESDIIPYQKSTQHLTQRQTWYNDSYLDMLKTVLSSGGFYYSPSFDLSRSLQYLCDNTSPDFVNRPVYDRAAPYLVWNSYLISPVAKHRGEMERAKYCVPIIHGFVGIRNCAIQGSSFKLILVSRRPSDRPGVRFHVRGADPYGSTANFVETEQIVEIDNGSKTSRKWTSFLQLRGSIPLLWSQKPNLKWQPQPYLRPQDDQLEAYLSHMKELRRRYGGSHVIVNLVNQKGREHRVGGELARVSLQASLDFVKYVPFDFHAECKNLNWDRLSVLRDQLRPDIQRFGFFYSTVANPTEIQSQHGYFRTNCMDCLDRTNVAQAMIAKESLTAQLRYLGVIGSSVLDLDLFPDFMFIFRNLWADNGDECSKQYAGTGALKTDYTRFGKRTMNGAMADGVNALTRYFKNNFSDGHKLDALHLFLGYFRPSFNALPDELEQTLLAVNINGAAVAGAIFCGSMTVLSMLVSENLSATFFWFIIFVAFASFIFFNGEEFVRKPKLKIE